MVQRCLLRGLLRIACQNGICVNLYKSMGCAVARGHVSAFSALHGGDWVSFAGGAFEAGNRLKTPRKAMSERAARRLGHDAIRCYTGGSVALSLQIAGHRGHLVDGLKRRCVQVIGGLRLNHLGEFLGDIDVGSLHSARV